MIDQAVSIDELARTSGVSARQIARYRKGAVMPVDAHGRPSPNAHALADALDMRVNDLVGDSEPEAMAS
jgi:predicted transcriptional regulator